MEAVMICSSFFFSNWLSIFKHEARCTYNEWPCWFVIYKLTKVFSLKIAKHVYGADKGTCEPQKHWTWFCIVLVFQGAGNILLIGFSLCFSSAPWLMHQCSSFCSKFWLDYEQITSNCCNMKRVIHDYSWYVHDMYVLVSISKDNIERQKDAENKLAFS